MSRLGPIGLAVALLASSAAAKTSVIGRVYPIIEPDALAEIEARVAKLSPSLASPFGLPGHWSALQAAPLPFARKTRSRDVIPFYTLEFEITGAHDELLYPKGYRFNPLLYIRLPARLIVTPPGDLDWALGIARAADWVILTGGDVLALSKQVNRPLFILEERVRQRLDLRAAPVIVEQQGAKLRLTEIELDRRQQPYQAIGWSSQ